MFASICMLMSATSSINYWGLIDVPSSLCLVHSKMPNINLILLVTKTVSAFVSLKQISLASEVCFSSLKLKFPVISGLKKNQSKYQEQLFIANT